MTQDVLTWGALIISGGSIVTLIRFWMMLGSKFAEVDDAKKRADSAVSIAQAAMAQASLSQVQLNEYKVEAAEKVFKAVSDLDRRITSDLGESERRLTASIDKLGERFDRMTVRLDAVLAGYSQPKEK